ncbi:hypothetical protein D3C78_1843930 [compost metagenome]
MHGQLKVDAAVELVDLAAVFDAHGAYGRDRCVRAFAHCFQVDDEVGLVDHAQASVATACPWQWPRASWLSQGGITS